MGWQWADHLLAINGFDRQSVASIDNRLKDLFAIRAMVGGCSMEWLGSGWALAGLAHSGLSARDSGCFRGHVRNPRRYWLFGRGGE